MDKEKSLRMILKISAIFLWYFTPLFFLIVSSPLLFHQGTFWGDLIVRHPYQWDYEFFFALFYLVWGVFVWKAAKNPSKDISLVKFTAWAFLVNAISLILVGFFRRLELAHLATDSIPWIVISAVIFYFSRGK